MHKKGLIFVFLTALISGASIFLNKFGVEGIDSSVFTFAKNTIVALFLFSIIFLFKEYGLLKELNGKQWGRLALIGLVGGSIPFLLFFKGLQLANAGMAAFIHKTMFIFVGVLAIIFLKEKLSKKVVIGAILLLAGNFLFLKLRFFSFGYGELLILAATLFWAAETIISKQALEDLDSKIVAFGRMFFGSLFILAFLGFTDKITLITTLGINQLVWIFLTSCFLFLYVFTWYSGLKYVKASIATSILLIGSPITTLLSYAFLGSLIAPAQIVGMVSLILGLGLLILNYKKSFVVESTS